MGDVKQNMGTTTPKSQGLMDRILARKKNRPVATVQSDEDIANSFADHVAHADDKLEKLIGSKNKDLANEKGQEKENSRKLKLLTKMQSHLEEIAELAQEYKE